VRRDFSTNEKLDPEHAMGGQEAVGQLGGCFLARAIVNDWAGTNVSGDSLTHYE
jgi:hypothetical protein